jgi:hypothetical protein
MIASIQPDEHGIGLSAGNARKWRRLDHEFAIALLVRLCRSIQAKTAGCCHFHLPGRAIALGI